MARPTKLDDLRAKRILDALRSGHSFAAAARAGGINESTLHDWRSRGQDGEPEFAKFSERVVEAESEAEARCIRVIKSAIESDDMRLAADNAWRWLERRRPKEWAKVETAATLVAQADAYDGDGTNDVAVLESLLEGARSRKAG